MAKTGAIAKLEAIAKNRSSAKSLKEWADAGGDVPLSYKGREHVWAKKVKKFAEGGGVSRAAQIDGNDFVLAAQKHGLGQDIGTLNKMVALVNKGATVEQAARAVAQGGKERNLQAGGIAKLAKMLKGTQETLPAAERQANLAKFLEPSKVPQRLYHGTTASEGGKGTEAIRRFKPSKEGALGSGVYLTPDPKFAGSYAEQVGSSMLPVYAQLKNPLILRGSGVPDKYKDPMIEALELLGMDSAKAARMVERAYEGKGYIGKEVQTRAQAQGYDGLIEYDRDGNLAEVVSYNPNAVKSAIGNRGTYDTRSPELNKADGGDVKPYIGYRRAGRRPESQQNREASANIPVAVARGLVSGTLGLPGDIESIARLPYELITGNESPTILPTSSDIEKRLPFRGASQTPAGQLFTGAGQLAGGAYTGPLSGARAAMAVPRAAVRAGQDFAMAAGQSGPKIFIGPKAKTWDQAKADKAIYLEQAGVSPMDTWLLTGTMRGPDGILRQEISDVGAIYRNPADLKELGKQKKQEALDLQQRLVGIPGQKDMFPKALTEAKKPAREQVKRLKEEAEELGRYSDVRGQSAKFVLEHPELYKAYPELADITVYQGGSGLANESAALRGGKQDMEVDVTQRGLRGNPRSSMLHEMQHAVQTLEDMAPGGNTTTAFRDPITHDIYKRRMGELTRPSTFEEFQAANRYPEDKAQAAYDEYVRTYKPIITKDIERAVQQEAAMEYYKRLAGEAEARATQYREGMTASQRADEFPYASYDVLPEDLIVKPARRDPLQPELDMAEGGAAFGRYTTGKKYQGAVKRAKGADVNTLADPRTYAAVMGLLGSAPDQLGFSVMHPDYKGIQKAGERGFIGGTALAVAPVLAPLTRGLPVGASIKPVGGNWLTGSVERAMEPLKRYDLPDLFPELGSPPPNSVANKALNQWIDRNLTNYVKKQMATPDDPVRGLAERGILHIEPQGGAVRAHAHRDIAGMPVDPTATSPLARAWEDVSDAAVVNSPYKDYLQFGESMDEGLRRVGGEFAVKNPDVRAYAIDDVGTTASNLGFDHIVDVLKQDLDAGRIRPEQLNKVSMEQAVRRTYEYDQEMAKRMREAQIKITEGMPVYREYPEGYRWIELTTPESKLPEGFSILPDQSNYRNPGNELYTMFDDKGNAVSTGASEAEALRLYKRQEREKVLEDALKYEGDTMGHCVGGYCPDVLEGRSRIYSLRDAKGEPHVTVEVRPGVYTPFDMPEDIYPIYRQHMAEGVAAHGGRPGAMEWMQHFYPERYVAKPEEIVQIKGKQNRAPNEQYLPFVQDFVRGGQWSDVGDFKNTGLYRKGDFIDEFTPNQLDAIGQGEYLTMDEIKKLREGKPWTPIDRDPELDINLDDLGMKAGGAVDCGCDDEPKMQAGGATSLLRGLLSSPAKKLTKAEMDALRAKGLGVPGQDFADVMNPADVMRMSEALGNAGAEGKTLNITQTDRSRVFGQNRGGPGFSGLQLTSVPHQQAGSTWGVGKPSHATRLINANTPDTIWSTFIGSPTQHMSNPVTVERIFKEHQKGNAPVDLIERMNQRLNDAVHPKTGKLVFPNGIDVSSPSALSSAQTFDQRKLLAETLAGKGVGGPKKGGSVVDAAKIIREETDPLLMGSPTYAVGPRLWTIDKNVGIYRPDLNAAFPYQVTGTDLGMVFEPTPIEMAALDFVSRFEGRKNKSGKLQPMGHKDLTATTPKQFVSDKYLTFLQKEGYADGGPVSGLSVLEKV